MAPPAFSVSPRFSLASHRTYIGEFGGDCAIVEQLRPHRCDRLAKRDRDNEGKKRDPLPKRGLRPSPS